MNRRAIAAVGAAVMAAFALAGAASADTSMPVRLSISLAPIARARAPLPIAVRVSADPGALDSRTGPLRIRVKLAGECGGTYQYTAGPVLLDQRLSPQPTTGHAYSTVVRGKGRPTAYGEMTVCAWLEEEGTDRDFASDQSVQVDVSQACTVAASRYDAVRRQYRRRRRHRQRGKAALTAARRRARRACGPGVAL